MMIKFTYHFKFTCSESCSIIIYTEIWIKYCTADQINMNMIYREYHRARCGTDRFLLLAENWHGHRSHQQQTLSFGVEKLKDNRTWFLINSVEFIYVHFHKAFTKKLNFREQKTD